MDRSKAACSELACPEFVEEVEAEIPLAGLQGPSIAVTEMILFGDFCGILNTYGEAWLHKARLIGESIRQCLLCHIPRSKGRGIKASPI